MSTDHQNNQETQTKANSAQAFHPAQEQVGEAELRFEQAVGELEQIVQRLNQPNINLDEAIDLYERGVKLAQRGRHLIGDAENRVNQLRDILTQPEGGGGNAPRS